MKKSTVLVRTGNRTIVLEDVHEVELIPARGHKFQRETQLGYPDVMRVVWKRARPKSHTRLQLVPIEGKTGDD